MTTPERIRRFRERTPVVQVPLAREIRDALDDIARDRGTSRAEVIREAIQRALRETTR